VAVKDAPTRGVRATAILRPAGFINTVVIDRDFAAFKAHGTLRVEPLGNDFAGEAASRIGARIALELD
jgi:hypothetical protein